MKIYQKQDEGYNLAEQKDGRHKGKKNKKPVYLKWANISIIESQVHGRLSMMSQIFLPAKCTNQLTFTKYTWRHNVQH